VKHKVFRVSTNFNEETLALEFSDYL